MGEIKAKLYKMIMSSKTLSSKQKVIVVNKMKSQKELCAFFNDIISNRDLALQFIKNPMKILALYHVNISDELASKITAGNGLTNSVKAHPIAWGYGATSGILSAGHALRVVPDEPSSARLTRLNPETQAIENVEGPLPREASNEDNFHQFNRDDLSDSRSVENFHNTPRSDSELDEPHNASELDESHNTGELDEFQRTESLEPAEQDISTDSIVEGGAEALGEDVTPELLDYALVLLLF